MYPAMSGPRPRIHGLQKHILVAQLSFVDLQLKHTHTLAHCLTGDDYCVAMDRRVYVQFGQRLQGVSVDRLSGRFNNTT